MSDHVIRLLRADEERTADTLVRTALHHRPSTDEDWAHSRHARQDGRTLGVFDDGTLIGTARSFDGELTVPGGARVPLAAVTGVGVRPNRTRRGVLTDLMRAQFADFAERGVVAANLHASEGRIYGRFGYGIATLGRSYAVDRRRVAFRDGVPRGGEVELLDGDTAIRRLPAIYAELDGLRAGKMSRHSTWWPGMAAHLTRATNPVTIAVHHGTGGPDGFAVYDVSRPDPSATSVLRVDDLHYGNPEAFAGLLRYLCGVDLVDRLELAFRAPDEAPELLFTDPRTVRTTGLGDDTWLRLVDVPAALAARERGPGSVVLEVDDPVLPANSGRYHVSTDDVSQVDTPAGLRLGVDTLAMIYLGGWRPSALAAAGRIEVRDPAAVGDADSLFGTLDAPWCGTFF